MCVERSHVAVCVERSHVAVCVAEPRSSVCVCVFDIVWRDMEIYLQSPKVFSLPCVCLLPMVMCFFFLL